MNSMIHSNIAFSALKIMRKSEMESFEKFHRAIEIRAKVRQFSIYCPHLLRQKPRNTPTLTHVDFMLRGIFNFKLEFCHSDFSFIKDEYLLLELLEQILNFANVNIEYHLSFTYMLTMSLALQ